MKTSIIIDLAGNLEARAKRYSRAIHRMSRSSQRDMNMMHKSARSLGRGIDRMGNRYTALLTGGGLAVAGKQVMDLERRFTMLENSSGKSADKIKMLKEQIFDVSQSPDIRIDPNQLVSAVETIAAQTGDIDLAKSNLRSLAMLISATGAAGADAGALVGNLMMKFQIKTPKGMLRIIDTMSMQGDVGAIEVKDLSTQGERFTTAYAKTGRTGFLAAREMGAFLQIIKTGVSSAEETATAQERIIDVLTGASASKYEKAGLKIWDREELKKGNKIARSIPEIIKDIVRATNGDPELIAKLIPESMARRAVMPFALEFKATGGFSSYNKILALVGDGSTLLKKSKNAADDASASLQNLYTAWGRFADAKLTGPIRSLAETLNDLGSNNVMEAAGNVATAGAVAYAGRKIYKGGMRGTRAMVKAGSSQALKRTAAGALLRTGARAMATKGVLGLNPIGAALATGMTAFELGSAIEKALIGGRLGSWLYDVTHSKIDVNLQVNQHGRAKVQSVQTSGIAGEADIDNGVMRVGQ